ncbi:putative long-chain-fatty-acid-CoA ligase [Calycina marina]|uniref:Long-chain-fatty-acid-CoA ligase n=1 Tax=Calycina marina TaxID=1763456 RepID=A0A9P7Z7V1_9HELO|nr:putative long-chain-fatty-acid-CoA ligase [Calycina marina]
MATEAVSLRRLRQTTSHLSQTPVDGSQGLSIVHGPTNPPLLQWTLGDLLDEQASAGRDKECLVVSWTGARWTYGDLQRQSQQLAKALLATGVQSGDRVGILAGNCEEYAAIFFAAGYIGAILVVLNSTYTATEAKYALNHSGCKLLFIQERYGRHSNLELLAEVRQSAREVASLKAVIMLKGQFEGFSTYQGLLEKASEYSDRELEKARKLVDTHDICNLQYTSGSTGDPKAAMLTHHNLVNNSRAIGDRMAFTSADILCCPPPLFHCFGLVLGLLACITHGSTIVLPAPTFSAAAVLSALSDENCTALHGVPAMFEELLALPRPDSWSCTNLRTGIVAGAPVPKALMKRMLEELNMTEYTSSYGLTEASPTCFNAETHDTIHRRTTTVGKIMPHMHAKIVDRNGAILPVGQRGELYMAGYSLQKGYWNNPIKTAEAMAPDEQGIVWLSTGDEACFDAHGYCTITGRFKDIVIRGGENIYPVEIEERLAAHPSGVIARAAVVGVRHCKYGEVVSAFLLPAVIMHGLKRPSDEELKVWVREVLGRHKAPTHLFWFGDEEVGMQVMPQTGSGKVKKHLLREVAQRLVDAGGFEMGMDYEGWPAMKECTLEF